VLATGEAPEAHSRRLMARSLTGGFLVQEPNNIVITADDLEIVTERSPTESELADLLFAFNVCRYVTSNAIVYAKDGMCVGIGAGQASRTDAAILAARKANTVSKNLELEHSLLRNSVVASDGAFSFAESLITAVDAGVTAIIQPGGSALDKDVIAAADDRAIAMVFTKTRHFKH
jgi:phosphoribosylaminoimidazolecarboxamide formyltransferase/IMP cyclohydrolase